MKTNMNPIDIHLIKDTNRTKQREYCSECNRVTGTDYLTGKCGGCIMRLMVKDTRKRTAKRNKEHEVESPYIWLAIPVLLISWILIRWIIG